METEGKYRETPPGLAVKQRSCSSGDIVMDNLTQPDCPSSSKVALEYQMMSSWAYVLTKDMVAVLGILGNVSTAVILLQRRMRNSFNDLLVALALFDTILLVTTLAYSCVWASKKGSIHT